MNMHFNSITQVYSESREIFETNKKLSRSKKLISTREPAFCDYVL